MRRTVIVYILFTLGTLLLLSVSLRSYKTGVSDADVFSLESKVEYYLQNTECFDLLFFGDSRTYCAIQPERIDAILGTHSYNTAHWSNWFPTQYSILLDVVSSIPSDTVVYWSIGYQNLTPGVLQPVYPIALKKIPKYLQAGFSPLQLEQNIAADKPPLWLFYHRLRIYQYVRELMTRNITTVNMVQQATQSVAEASQAKDDSQNRSLALKIRKYEQDPEVIQVNKIHAPDGHVTSLVLHKKRGSYERIELDHEFFRAKQEEMGGKLTGAWDSDPAYVNLFHAMLQLFKEHNIHLVVGTFEEGPHMFVNEAARRKLSTQFRQFLKKELKPYGFPLLEVDFSQLKADDYFDYNHLNQEGIKKYTPLLAEELRPYVHHISTTASHTTTSTPCKNTKSNASRDCLTTEY